MRNPIAMRVSLFVSSVVFVSLSSLYACGGNTQNVGGDNGDAGYVDSDGSPIGHVKDAGSDADNGQPSTTYPAFKVDAPQVVDSSHGPVLAAPKVVPVYFHNDDSGFTAQITTFLNKLPTSTYWGPAVTEYGIGAISVTAPVQLTEDATTGTLDDSAIQSWLAAKIAANDVSFPQPDSNTIYALFYPAATSSITLGQNGGASCTDFGGYHQDIMAGSAHAAYAVIPRCPSFDGFTGLDVISATASHEIIEAATDPYPLNAPAYTQLDDNHVIWEFLLGGGEVADMCAQNDSSYFTPSDIGSIVTRSWSNAAAKAGHDPCVPAAGGPYFNSMPVLTESVDVGGQLKTKGVTIPVGQTKTIEVDLFSDAPTSGPWQVDAFDSATLQGQTPELELTWDRTSGVNGEKLHLTITVDSASQFGAEGFIIESTLNGRKNLWAGLVAN